MDDFVYNGGAIKFSVESGRVLPGQQKISKTHVSSSGGGGYVSGGSGFVDAPKITSTITTEQEFWLQARSGHQVPVRISGDVMAVNVDQEVSLLRARHPTKGGVWLVGIVNHSARKTAWLLAPGDVVKRAGLVRWWPTLLLALLSLVLFESVLGAWFLGLLPAGVLVFRQLRRQRAVAVALGAHLWQLEQALMSWPPLAVIAKGQP
jgi:hypothetical protein